MYGYNFSCEEGIQAYRIGLPGIEPRSEREESYILPFKPREEDYRLIILSTKVC